MSSPRAKASTASKSRVSLKDAADKTLPVRLKDGRITSLPQVFSLPRSSQKSAAQVFSAAGVSLSVAGVPPAPAVWPSCSYSGRSATGRKPNQRCIPGSGIDPRLADRHRSAL